MEREHILYFVNFKLARMLDAAMQARKCQDSSDKGWTLGNAVVIYGGGHEWMKLLLVPAIAQSIRIVGAAK